MRHREIGGDDGVDAVRVDGHRRGGVHRLGDGLHGDPSKHIHIHDYDIFSIEELLQIEDLDILNKVQVAIANFQTLLKFTKQIHFQQNELNNQIKLQENLINKNKIEILMKKLFL